MMRPKQSLSVCPGNYNVPLFGAATKVPFLTLDCILSDDTH